MSQGCTPHYRTIILVCAVHSISNGRGNVKVNIRRRRLGPRLGACTWGISGSRSAPSPRVCVPALDLGLRGKWQLSTCYSLLKQVGRERWRGSRDLAPSFLNALASMRCWGSNLLLVWVYSKLLSPAGARREQGKTNPSVG